MGADSTSADTVRESAVTTARALTLSAKRTHSTASLAAYGTLPLRFEINQGQTDRHVKFLAHLGGGSLFLTGDEAVIALAVPPTAKRHTPSIRPRVAETRPLPMPMRPPIKGEAVMRLRYVGGNPHPQIVGLDQLPGITNYFIGNDPRKWHTNIHSYARIELRSVYPGIDLVYHGGVHGLEYDWIVAPGVNPGLIRLSVEGATGLRLDRQGNVVLQSAAGPVRELRPTIYQMVAGTRRPVSGHYVLRGHRDIGVAIGRHDARAALIIDPVLSYSTYLGGSGDDEGQGIAVDSAGNAYVTGSTASTNFPTANALRSACGDAQCYWGDAFVSKLNAAGTALVYSTYLGGNSEDSGYGIAVDSMGDAYVTGATFSTDFPTLNALQGTLRGYEDAFVTKLNAAGNALIYSTDLGGSNDDVALGIALDGGDDVYITGQTLSGDFPTVNPLQMTYGGGTSWGDAFVAKLNPTGSALVYSTYLGGSDDDRGNGIAVDTAGNAYVTGTTYSADFPTANALRGTRAGYSNAFVSKLNPTGSALIYSTYLGGNEEDRGYGITVDGTGNAYVTGDTTSTTFPTVNPLQATCGGCVNFSDDAFVSELNPTGSALVYSTYLGGSQADGGYGIAVDSVGNVYVTGYTTSGDFPTANALQGTLHGSNDAFVSELNAAGSALVYSTYLGGNGPEQGNGIAVDNAGNVYVTGNTYSTDFPIANALQGACGGGSPPYSSCFDAFVTKIGTTVSPSPPPLIGPTASESLAGSNAAHKTCSCNTGSPVNDATGDFWHTFTDLSIPGRGISLQFTRTYNSLSAAQDGPLGFGWTDDDNMSIATDATGAVTVTEDNGSTVPFTATGSTYQAPSRVLATLTANGDGTLTYTRPDQTRLIFSAPSPGIPGHLLTEEDRNGYVTALGYDATGHLASVTDPAGRTLTFTDDAQGHILSVTDPGNRRLTFSYDAAGNLASATDMGGGVTTFTYDANHHLLTMTDPRHATLTNTYDALGRVLTQTDPLSRTTTFTYTLNADGSQTTTITDPKGNVTQELYTSNVLLSRTEGVGTPQAATWTYTYDPATLGVASVTDPDNHVTTNTWDSRGNLLSTTDPLSRTTSYAYNSFNETVAITDPLGVTTQETYDAQGNLLTVTRPLTQTGQTATTTYAYDPAHPGDVIAVTDPDGHTTTYAYDQDGDRIRATDALSDTTTDQYDVLGRLIASVSPNGNVGTTNPLSYTTTMTYDAFGDPRVVTDPLGHRTTSYYDADRNLVATTDARNHTIYYGYDLDNERIVTVQPGGSLLRTGYDADGQVISQTDALTRTTTFGYDSLGRLISQTDPLSRTTTYSYDGAGNRTGLTDAQGRTTTYGYDAANELTSVTYSDGTTPNVAYTYTPDGQRATMTDGTGTTTYSYDSRNRLMGSTDGAGQSLRYGYDLAGNLTALTYPDGSQVQRGYDTANRLISVSDWLGHTTRFGYDADGNLLAQTYPNTTTATMTYNRADQLTSLTTRRNGTPLWAFGYARDALGQVAASVDPLERLAHLYAYTPLNQLAADARLNGTTVHSAYWGNDAADEVTAMVQPTGAVSRLGYDQAGELTTLRTTTGNTVMANLTLGYNADGDRSSQSDSVSGATSSIGYDQADRLITATTPLGSATYAYNGDGLRMSKTISGTAEAFTWDTADGLPLLVQDGSTRYVTGPGGLPLELVSATNAVLYVYHDQLGSTRALLTGAGQVAAAYTYDPYGTRHVLGGVVVPFGYAGQYTDAETGLVYLRARYYDPTTAQFLTRDPLENATGQPYAYVGDNPLNATDFRGTALTPTQAAAAFAACGVGSLTGVVSLEVSDLVNHRYSGDPSYWGALAEGCVSWGGAILLLGNAPPGAVSPISSAAGVIAGEGVKAALGGHITPGEVIQNLATSVGSALLFDAILPPGADDLGNLTNVINRGNLAALSKHFLSGLAGDTTTFDLNLLIDIVRHGISNQVQPCE